MDNKKFNFDESSKQIVERAYASASFILTDEQTRKLIQDKFDRAREYHEAQLTSPVIED